jgi:hypothetical protein
MATATIPAQPVEASPELPPVDGARLIGNRWIIRLEGHWPRWRQIVTRRIPTYSTYHDGSGKAGFTERVEVAYEWSSDPEPIIQQLMETLSPLPFDPRPESPLHDQLELAERSGFEDLAGALRMAAKIKPRELAPAMLGEVWLSRGITSKLCLGREPIMAFLHRHVRGDWGIATTADVGELTADQLWAPPVFGQAVENRAAVLANRGLVQSVYVEKLVPTRGPEELKICTFLGHTTVCYAPRQDCC